MHSAEIGRRGEDAAAAFLVTQKGYTVLSQNVRTPKGEIDLVCRTPDGGLAAVEVKATLRKSAFHPAERAAGAKIARLTKLAAWLSSHYPDVGVQVDIVALHWKHDQPVIEHFENVTA
jgi:putative endonuclease